MFRHWIVIVSVLLLMDAAADTRAAEPEQRSMDLSEPGIGSVPT